MIDSYQRLIRESLFIFSGILFFSITIFILPAAADTPIAFGQTISESISNN